MKKNDILFYVMIFLTTFLVMQFFNNGKAIDPVLDQGDIGMKMSKNEYAIGKPIELEIKNNTAETIVISSECPDAPLQVFMFKDKGYEEIKPDLQIDCKEAKDITITAGGKTTITYNDYLYSLFGKVGRYKIEYQSFSTPEFIISEPGIFTMAWRTIIYQPMLNLLIAILTYIPGHNLGLGIIVLTIIIRTILLFPSQKGMKAQRRMQLLQPKLEELKKKHANDQQRLAQETMLLWKNHKVNPLSSCLPLLIQLPVLIGLYMVIQNGLTPDRASQIYGFMPAFSIEKIGTFFLGLNLVDKSLILLPVIVGGLQFVQMKLMMAKQKKDKGAIKTIENDMKMVNNMMLYMMPIMIAVFTASAPAAVGLYWGVSTLYGILQQLVVNKDTSMEDGKVSAGTDDVKIRVINKNSNN